jgi:MFS family permease
VILWGLLYYEPLYYEAVKGYTPILTGVALFPATFTVAPAAIITGVVITTTGKYRWGTWAGWILTTLGVGLLTYMKVDTSVPAWVFLNLVPGVGMGMLFSAMAIAVQASSTNADMAWAVTMFAFLRAFGQTVGVAVGGVTFQNQMKKELLKYPLLAGNATDYSRDASGLVQIIKAMPESLAKTQLLKSYTDALRYVYIVLCALAAVAMVASFFTKALPLDREFETDQGFRHQERNADEEKPAS